MTEQELSDLAAGVAKSLRWAAFLVLVSLAILLIDLQLKRAIGRQAVTATGLIGRAMSLAERGGGGRDTETERGRDDLISGTGSAGGRDGLVADGAGMAAGADRAGDSAADGADSAPVRAGKRAPGNGRRAGGTESGS